MKSHGETLIDPSHAAPGLWLEEHGDYLYRYALRKVRDDSVAEDIVQETLLAALRAYSRFEGRGSERTWLTGILKHKVIDHFRRVSRTAQFNEAIEQSLENDDLFLAGGEWEGHWREDKAPVEWSCNPEKLAEQGEFRAVLERCLDFLPTRIAAAFTLREVEGAASEEICGVLNITPNNLWVMLHRARMQLRRCLETDWFRGR